MKKFYNQLRTIKYVFILIILPLLLVGVANGQTITIGSGTASNGYTGYPAPFGNYYSGARHQFIYRKAELQAAGGVNGIISQFGFNVTATNGSGSLTGYTVKMGQTATNTLTTFQTNLTTVFSPTSYLPVTGWNLHTLSTPFAIDTSLNLVVEVCFFNGVNTYTYNASTQWTTGLPANTTIYNRDDVAGSGCPSTAVNSATGNTSRPNARLVITQGSPMAYSTTFLTQNNIFPIQVAKTNHEIMRIGVVTTGVSNALSITQFDLATNGTTNAADITRARIYSTGNSKVFDTTTLFGSISNPGFSPYVITGSKSLGIDTSYFWLTYDINPSASVGNIFDAEVSSVTVASTVQFLTSTSATGSRTILAPLSGTYQVGTGQTYARLENAISDVYYRGISGDVELVLNNTSDTLYNTLEIQEFTNPANNKLTIRPATNGLITGNVAGPLIRITASNVVIDGSNSAFTSTRNLTITNTNITAPQVVSINSSGTKVISNCSILNTNIINGAAVSSALVLQDIGGTLGGYYQNILIKNNSIQKAYIGAYIFGAGAATMNIMVDSNDVNATGVNQNRLVGIYMQGVIGGRIVKNNIGNFNTTNAEVKAGIWLATGAQNIIIERNRISNVGVTTTTSAGHGIRISTGLTSAGISVRNNIIDSIYGGGTTTFHSVSNPGGITLSSTQTGIQIAYNTIKMGGNILAASNANSAGIRILTGSTADVRNNYVNNTLGLSGATGIGTYAIAIETSTAQFSAINTNNYYVNASGSGVKAIGRIGATDYLTLSAWKGAVTADAASVSENTPFVSATDLHIPASTSSQMEGAATVIAGIDSDYDLDARSTTAPDIGSDEFAGIVADLTAPTISYTVLSNNSSTLSRTVTNVTITDATGVNVSFGTAPRIYYKKASHANTFGGNSALDNGWKYVEASNTSSPFSFNIDYTILFTGIVVATDTIQYFVVAQDYAAAINTGANPSAGFAGTSVSAITSAPTTPNFYIVTPAPLAGPYQVGSGQAYVTLTAAVNDLNLRGVSAPVTFNLADASYSAGETFPIVIKKIDGASATNTVTIKPATGINSVITGSSSSSLIRMEEASYITINGSNNATTSMNLTVKNTSTSGSVIHIASLGAGRGSTNDAVLNTIIAANSVGAASVHGIFIGSNTIGSTGADNSNISITNDSIYYVGKGIYALGTTAITGLNISNNKIGNSVISNSVYSSGIEVDNATSPVITKNNIVNIKSTVTDLNGPVAIRLSNTSNAAVTKNKIAGVAYTGTTGFGAKGIDLVAGNSNASITNNFLADISADGDGSDIVAYGIFGVVLRTGSGHSVRNNSIWMSGNRAANTYFDAISAGIFVASPLSNVDVRNNMIQNTQTSSNTSSGTNYGVYSLAASSAFSFLNYNNYFVSSATAAVTKATGYIGGANQLTLANWKSATGLEANSANDSAQFTSLTDLHLTGTSRGNTRYIATPLAAIPTDIDDENRNALYPYMGADENVTFPLPVDFLRFTANRKSVESTLLNWATASETNNSHFIIERSADSKSFSGIGSLKGKGNSKTVINYTFTDETAADFAKSANGIVYYRLTQVDVDGKTSYSKIASVLFSNEVSGVVVYPNPVTANLTIANTGIESGLVQIVITDIQGRELVNKSIEMSTSVNKQLVDMSDFEGGIYFVKTVLNGKVSNYKVLRAN